VIVPGRLTLMLALVTAVFLIAAVVEPLVAVAALAADVALLGACVWKGRDLKRIGVEVTRDNWGRVQVGRQESFVYKISNRSRHEVIVRVRQIWPDTMKADQIEVEVPVAGGEIVRVALKATAWSRGSVQIAPADVEIRLHADWVRRRWATDTGELKIFPNLRGMSEYETLRRHHASTFGGLHRQRMLGAGREFDQLRDYGPDDDFRDINWKATARRQHPITNLYQAERSRDVLLCLDCGRMMGNPVGNVAVLDHAIDAAIMVAHVANRQGDRVGLALFRDVVHRFVKPASGMPAVHRIIEELVDAKTEGVFPSYSALMTALRTHQNRRSLIFFVHRFERPAIGGKPGGGSAGCQSPPCDRGDQHARSAAGSGRGRTGERSPRRVSSHCRQAACHGARHPHARIETTRRHRFGSRRRLHHDQASQHVPFDQGAAAFVNVCLAI